MNTSTAVTMILAGFSIFILTGCPEKRTSGQKMNLDTKNRPNIAADLINPQETARNFMELTVDLANYHACKYLKDKIMLITSEGAQTFGAQKPDTGVFWIEDCKTTQINPAELKINLKALGWRWIEREKEVAGAAFAVAENIKFYVDISTVGTFDLFYDPQKKILTIYFIPTQKIEADFTLTGDVDVETDTLWSSVVGEAAQIIGKAPGTRAVETIEEKVIHRVRSKLQQGFTIIVDMCTGFRYTKFGTFQKGILPPSSGKDENFAVKSAAKLYKGSLLMAGPFQPDKNNYATFDNLSSSNFQAMWVCLQKAREIADDYIQGKPLNTEKPLSSLTISGNQTTEFYPPENLQCPLVLIMKPMDQMISPAVYNYAVIQPGIKLKPLAECPDQ